MAEQIKAKDAAPGRFYMVGNEIMILVRTAGEHAFYADEDADIRQRSIEEQITHLPDCTGWDWEPTPKHPPVPEGWRLVDPEKDGPKQKGDRFWNRNASNWLSVHKSDAGWVPRFFPNFTYIRRIEPTYRPFASAEEFDAHAHRIVVNIGTGTRRRIDHWGNTHINGMSWDMAFRKYTFLDGTPFGVEVKE